MVFGPDTAAGIGTQYGADAERGREVVSGGRQARVWLTGAGQAPPHCCWHERAESLNVERGAVFENDVARKTSFLVACNIEQARQKIRKWVAARNQTTSLHPERNEK
jgi:hypothetical protein